MLDELRTTQETYNKTVDQYTKNTDSLLPAKELENFCSLLPKNAVILDLGCGPGRDAEYFNKEGYKVTGIDFSEKMIEAAKKRVKKATFEQMDMVNLILNDNTFDGVWAHSSLLHIPKEKIHLALSEVHRVLKKGGIFYLSVKPGKGEKFEGDARYDGAKKFWSFFTRDELVLLLRKAKFSILEVYLNTPNNEYNNADWLIAFCKKE